MEDSYGVRRRDTTKGPPLRVLSLDGGGVRGYSMLIIVQELMHRTFVETEGRAPRRHEIPKPCDHFDLIVGTGTGGLIALMLGRLRLDLETCKELYVRMTRIVFETDKTIAGIPYRSTLFKASKLEEAIRAAVREHTVFQKEGNDEEELDVSTTSLGYRPTRHQSNASTVSFSARSPSYQTSQPMRSHNRYGNPNARLYDTRENRTKTAITAMYKNSPRNAPPAILRSYDSRKEPPPEFDCKIWQAGRATCSIGLAFKPVQIGQSIFHDDGGGTFNPSPEALDEAVINEWPGREIGVFVSVGTGKRPKGSDANQHVWYEDFMGEFAEARRKLISKIEGCEKIHEYMIREHLAKRGVNVENYFRLNVEVGVGEFGMNEWHRLGEISTGTRRYMGRPDEQKMIHGISTRLAKICRAKIRWERAEKGLTNPLRSNSGHLETPMIPELAGDDIGFLPPPTHQSPRDSFDSGQDDLAVGNHASPRASSSYSTFQPDTAESTDVPEPLAVKVQHPQDSPRSENGSDRLMVTSPSPADYRNASGADLIAIMSPDEYPQPHHPSRLHNAPPPQRIEPPPLPPKTPLPDHVNVQRPKPPPPAPPYPIDDEAPPPVNMARKPNYR